MPVLEAMALGTRVACSNRTSIPQAAGGAALLFDPEDVGQLTSALCELHDNDALVSELVRHERRAPAAQVNPDETVNAYLRVLDEVATGERTPTSEPPRFTVVVASYQQGEFIERTIRSVLDQDADMDVVVHDGGSTDGTVEVLERFGDALRFWSGPDHGQADAVNQAIADARGDVIAWVNSDDVWYPNALATATEVLTRHPDLDGVYFAVDLIDEADRVKEPYLNEPWDPKRLPECCFVGQPAMFLRRRLLEQIGTLDPNLRFCMDYDLWLRAATVTDFVYVPVVAAGIRVHSATKTVSQRRAAITEICSMLRRTRGALPNSWLLAWAYENVAQRHPGDDTDVAHARAFAAAVPSALRSACLRWRTVPSPAIREFMRSSRAAAREGRDRSARAAFRRFVGWPAHFATGWIRRRVRLELEPRLAAIEATLGRIERVVANSARTPYEQSAGRGAEREGERLRTVDDEFNGRVDQPFDAHSRPDEG